MSTGVLEIRGKRRKWTKEEFVKVAKEVHGDLYGYELFEYKGANEHGEIICRKCKVVFKQTPSKHCNGRQGCKECGKNRGLKKRSLRLLNKKFEGVVQPNEYKVIPLGNGVFSKVSNEDFKEVGVISWKLGSKGYAMSTKHGALHRYLLKPPKDMFVDHINRDPLDNRRSNLRIVTPQENTFNAVPYGVSKYKGVSFNGKYIVVQLTVGKTSVLKKIVSTEEEGAELFDVYALHFQGAYAYLNFPEKREEYLRRIENIFADE